jgi:hypothetical protein
MINETLKEVFENGNYTKEQEQDISLFIDGLLKDETKELNDLVFKHEIKNKEVLN